MTETVSTRSSRNRRAVALMGWGCLVFSAFLLWNARQTGTIRAVTDEPVAFVLAAFAAFVGVFSWMLYNPGRRSAAESPSLFLAATATLFPPSIIGFCLMPIESPLRWWLALGLFLLCVIAVLSHVPDEFFGVPRGRHTYLTPIPAFDRVEGTVLDPNASWFKLEDLSRVVLEVDRPSLVPRSYLQRGESVRPATPTPRAELRPVSEVDDILGTNFDLGLLEDELEFDGRSYQEPSSPQDAMSNTTAERRRSRNEDTQRSTPPKATRRTGQATGRVYEHHNPESQRLRASQRTRRESARTKLTGRSHDRKTRHADSIRVERLRGGGTTVGELTSRAPKRRSMQRPTQQTARTETTIDQDRAYSQTDSQPTPAQRIAEDTGRRQRYEESPADPATTSQEQPRSRRESRESRDGTAPRQTSSSPPAESAAQEQRHQQQTSRLSSGIAAIPVPQDTVAPARQLFGQTIQREPEVEAQPRRQTDTEQPARRSRYDDEPPGQVRSTERREPSSTAAVGPSSFKKQQEPFERTRDDDGSELVEGVMKVHFDPGQKRANVHIPFSPPLPGVPEVECECVGGEDLRLKVPVRQSYGIRIEARRSNADEPLDAEIGFSAVYTED